MAKDSENFIFHYMNCKLGQDFLDRQLSVLCKMNEDFLDIQYMPYVLKLQISKCQQQKKVLIRPFVNIMKTVSILDFI